MVGYASVHAGLARHESLSVPVDAYPAMVSGQYWRL